MKQAILNFTKKTKYCLTGDLVLAAIFLIALISYTKLRCFDMYNGSYRQTVDIFGVRVSDYKSTGDVSIVAEELGLINQTRKTKCYKLDVNKIIYNHTSYSRDKALYFDLMGLAKLIKSLSLDDLDNQEAVLRFEKIWGKLAASDRGI